MLLVIVLVTNHNNSLHSRHSKLSQLSCATLTRGRLAVNVAAVILVGLYDESRRLKMDNHDSVDVGAAYKHPLYPVATILGSTILFTFLGHLTSKHVPKSAKSSWKFKNILISLVHALITGVWALHSLIFTPGLAQDIIHVYDASSYTLVCFSLGAVHLTCGDQQHKLLKGY
ncbi:TLCD1 [Bugula neritina]|uniref:TLCD1 n=1 Tax=Bugula neritina TaxID=10212 RepID=A0A7J7KSJ9_BUGNE|nr:TLCD1 [Bugula neritina]